MISLELMNKNGSPLKEERGKYLKKENQLNFCRNGLAFATQVDIGFHATYQTWALTVISRFSPLNFSE